MRKGETAMKSMWMAVVLAAGALSFVGAATVNAACGSCGAHKAEGKGKGCAKVELCGKCGEAKGGDKCCKDGAAKCEKCGLNAGSPGCKAKCCAKPEEKKP